MKNLLGRNYLVFILLALVIFLVYANSLPNSLVTDDTGLVKEGNNLLTWKRILIDPETGSFSAAPLRTLVYSFTYWVAGIQPWLLRLENILFHLGSTFLAFLIIKKLVSREVALLSALLFAIHPLLSEAVVWISAGGYIQSSFFFLLSFYLYLIHRGRTSIYGLSLLFFTLSLLSLNRSLVLVLIFPLYEISFAANTGGLRKNWKKFAPYLVISFFWLLTFFTNIGQRATSLDKIYYRDGYFYNPLIQWPLAVGSYLSLLFWPQHLTYVHTNNQSVLGYIFRMGVLLGYFGGLVYLILKRKHLFFWLLWFLIPLLPSLTPFKIAFIVAERYAYLSTLGIIVLVSILITRLLKIKELRLAGYSLILIALTFLGARTIVRNTDWATPERLWEKTSEVSQDSSQAHLNLGVKYGKEGKYSEAEKEFIAAIQINPKIAEYYYNLAVLYFKTGQREPAKQNFQKAVELKPGYSEAQRGLDLLSK